MSLPSDVTPDIPTDTTSASPVGRHSSGPAPVTFEIEISREHLGLAAAALVTFFGAAVLGPRIAEARRPRPPRLSRRAQRAADAAQREAREAAATGRDGMRKGVRKLRRLGGGTIWR